jgi:hypothetical protein
MASSQARLAAPRLGEILQRSNRSVAEKPGPDRRRLYSINFAGGATFRASRPIP